MRTPIIAGNWKMNNTIKEGLDLVEGIKSKDLDANVDKVICVPYTLLKDVKEKIKDTDIKLGAQNMHYEDSGAYTGEISPPMLVEIGVDYVIIGHSERRQYFGETDEIVNKKIQAAFKHGIKPILCFGESLEEREEGREEEVIKAQILGALKDIEDIDDLVIAYEPIWAIGTGKTASSDQANQMLRFIRSIIKELYGEISEKIQIQYGGSVKADNIKDLMSKDNIDGALVGGASLKADDFAELINFKMGG